MNSYNGFSPHQRLMAYRWAMSEQAAGRRSTPTLCDTCGQDEGLIERHSEDYSKPFRPHIGRHALCYTGTVQRLGVETFLGSSGNLIGAGMPGQLQAFQEACPPYPPNLWTVPIRNPLTRRAYGRAVREFLAWCDDQGVRRWRRWSRFASPPASRHRLLTSMMWDGTRPTGVTKS